MLLNSFFAAAGHCLGALVYQLLKLAVIHFV